jgi:hypothetical protein
MTAPAFPIELEQVLFIRSSVESIPEHEPGGPDAAPVAPDNHIEVNEIPDEPRRFAATMRTHINLERDKKYPYRIEMEAIATLRADDTLKPEEAIRGALITAHSVLYGAIRESVAWITARQPYGPLLLGLSVLQSKKKPKDAPETEPPGGPI